MASFKPAQPHGERERTIVSLVPTCLSSLLCLPHGQATVALLST